jgi:hypothetical protein
MIRPADRPTLQELTERSAAYAQRLLILRSGPRSHLGPTTGPARAPWPSRRGHSVPSSVGRPGRQTTPANPTLPAHRNQHEESRRQPARKNQPWTKVEARLGARAADLVGSSNPEAGRCLVRKHSAREPSNEAREGRPGELGRYLGRGRQLGAESSKRKRRRPGDELSGAAAGSVRRARPFAGKGGKAADGLLPGVGASFPTRSAILRYRSG